MLTRRQTATVNIENVLMGAQHPVVVQAMTNTPTADVIATVSQIRELAEAGAELVRITVNDQEAAAAVAEIKKQLLAVGCTVPLIGDFHYNGHILLAKNPGLCESLAKFRINPGNVGKGSKKDENFNQMIQLAMQYQKVVRIGVNWGSIDQALLTELMDANAKAAEPKAFNEIMIDCMVESALRSIDLALNCGLSKDQLVVSVKMSHLPDMITAYQRLAKLTDVVLHLGLTEAGSSVKGIASSAAALGILLQQGIGDTIRVSLTPEPGIPRSREVEVCTQLLQALNLRHFRPSVTSCPGCGRTDSSYFVELADIVNSHISTKMPSWRQDYPGVEKLNIAVMGCVVNGPGESKYADIGISLPGLREEPAAPVYIDGKLSQTLRGDKIPENFIEILENYIHQKFNPG